MQTILKYNMKKDKVIDIDLSNDYKEVERTISEFLNKEYKEYIKKEKEEAARMEEFSNQVKERVISQFKVNQKVSKVVFIVSAIIAISIFIAMIYSIIFR